MEKVRSRTIWLDADECKKKAKAKLIERFKSASLADKYLILILVVFVNNHSFL